jgi:hypothetical protein
MYILKFAAIFALWLFLSCSIAAMLVIVKPLLELIKNENIRAELEIKKLQYEVKLIEEQVIPVGVE